MQMSVRTNHMMRLDTINYSPPAFTVSNKIIKVQNPFQCPLYMLEVIQPYWIKIIV